LVNNQFIKIYGVWLHLCHNYSLGHSAEGFGVEQETYIFWLIQI